MTHQVTQGFRYQWAGSPVIAMETQSSDAPVKVMHFDEARPWYHDIDWALPDDLEVQPSRYLHGAIPK